VDVAVERERAGLRAALFGCFSMRGGEFAVLRGFERGDVEADARVRRDGVWGIVGVVLRKRE